MRHGYRLKDMVEQFDAKLAESKALFSDQLDPRSEGRVTASHIGGGITDLE